MKKTRTHELLVALAVGIGGHAMAQDLSQDQARELDQAIEKYRQGTLTIEAAPGTAVIVEQMRH